MYFVYVLQNPQGRIYIGFTTHLEKRIQQHQQGEVGWTRARGPWKLVLCETFSDRSEAMRRERSLKKGKANQELRKFLSSSSAVERVPNTFRRSWPETLKNRAENQRKLKNARDRKPGPCYTQNPVSGGRMGGDYRSPLPRGRRCGVPQLPQPACRKQPPPL